MKQKRGRNLPFSMIILARVASVTILLVWVVIGVLIAPFVSLEGRPILFLFFAVPLLYFMFAFISLFHFRFRRVAETVAFFLLVASSFVILGFVIHEQEPVMLGAALPLLIVAVPWFKAQTRFDGHMADGGVSKTQ